MSDIIREVITTIASVGVGCISALVVCYINNKHENERLKISLESTQITNQKNMNIQYITNKRIDWINEVRNILAEYIAIAQECANKLVLDKKIVIPEKDYRDLNICLAKLRLLSNFDEAYEKEVLYLLDEIKNNISMREEFCPNKFQNDINSLTKNSQKYLKLEWHCIKHEIQ